MVRLLITTAYTGVPAGDTSLHINISVYNTTRELFHQIHLNSALINFLGTVSHELSLQPGTYQFSATAGNRYGSSPESELTAGTAVSGEGERELLHDGYWFTIIHCSFNSSHYCWSECLQCGDYDTSSECASLCDHLLLHQ